MSVITIRNSDLTVSVDTVGAELASIRTADGAEWLWQGDPNVWAGRAPILFPVVGRSPDDAVSFGGRRYPMKSHGFVRGADLAIVDQNADAVTLRLADNETTRAHYPFAFILDITFALSGDTLVNRAEVRNPGREPMPVSFGFHPGFVWPLPGGEGGTHTVTLAVAEEPPTKRLGDRLLYDPVDQPSVFTAGRFAPTPTDFIRDAIIISDLASRSLTFGIDGGPEVAVAFDGLDSLGIWQKSGAPYLCIEPWQGLPAIVGKGDAVEDRPGTVWIAPGAVRAFTMTITPRAAS
jgi:galactose mutarotase-like enzyme